MYIHLDGKQSSSSSKSAGSVHRPGKSFFVGMDSEIHRVEEFVLQNLAQQRPEYSDNTICKLWGIDNIDERDDLEFHRAAQGGGWTGWHCEGGPLHALYYLYMWHLLFPCKRGESSNDNDTFTDKGGQEHMEEQMEKEGEGGKEKNDDVDDNDESFSFPSEIIPNVFISKYQNG